MMANLRYEFTKLLTIRSTYIIAIFAMALSAFIVIVSLIVTKNLGVASSDSTLATILREAPEVTALLAAVGAILIVAHEYRHNTIAYTLTASRSRAKILLAKGAASIFYSLVVASLSIIVAIICYYIGLATRGADSMPTPDSEMIRDMLRAILYVVGLGLFALVITMLVRNIVFAIVAFFMIPTVEGFLGILLKDNAAYLPATALDQMNYNNPDPLLSPIKAGIIFLLYLAVGSLVAWYLFVKRDAN